jgi:tRNA (cmo5U34)-methyltransferase
MTGHSKDSLYATPKLSIPGFRFDRDVVDVFPDMIRRSVPGYETIVAMTGTLAERYAQPGSRLYDLGCSLGASTLAIRGGVHRQGCTLVAVDNAPDMIERCRQILDMDAEKHTPPVDTRLICANIEDVRIDDASLVVLNFTLQFIPPGRRQALLSGIYQGLRPGGILVLSEKVVFEDSDHNELMIDLHHSFKRANGYSDLEISQKRTALERVLIPETLNAHRQRLRDIGFGSVDVWFQCFNFASLIAIKDRQ